MRSAILMSGAVVALGLFSHTAASAEDVAAGQRLFNQCRACHQLGETARNGVGPHLNGLFGRNKGSVPGYTYSAAYQAIKDQVWTEENFRVYIRDPRGVTPGTKMVYAGMRDETQITNLIAFLRTWGPDGKRTQ